MVADTLKIVGSSSLLGLTVGCAQCHDHRYDPIPQADYYRLRAVFEPALDPAHWRRPGERLVSLYTDADRAKAAAVEAEAAKMQASSTRSKPQYVARGLREGAGEVPRPTTRPSCEAAFDTPADKRTAEQKKLVATNPKLNITPGVLYQYDQAAADELKKMQATINAKRAEKPVEDFVACSTEVPGRVPATKLFHRGDSPPAEGAGCSPAT